MISEIVGLISQFDEIDHIVIEDTVLQKSPQTMKKLSQIQGVLIGYCIEHGLPYFVLPPASWRKLLAFKQGNGIKREELKQQALQLVESTYHIQVSDDEADAICIGLAHIKKLTNTEDII